jgi:hypothetical protein
MTATQSEHLEDATVTYILETRKAFEDLRQVAAQLAGLLVLEAAGAQSGIPEHPMLAMAEQMYGDAIDGIQRARVTERARRHHECLLQVADAIRRALDAAHRSLAIDPILIPLRIAYAQLQAAASELPGFEMVSFEQGCCGIPVRSGR